MSNSNNNLAERFDEIASAAAAEQQVRAIVTLAKSPKLERSRAARREAWGALLATAQAHLCELDRAAASTKRTKKRVAVESAAPLAPSETNLSQPQPQ